MQIDLTKAGKKFYREWIFRNLDLSIATPDKVVVVGPNGSGKSTLLQLLSGAVIPTEGMISYLRQDEPLPADSVFRHISIAAPYLELIEEFTLQEIVDFHFRFKKPVSGFGIEDVLKLSGLSSARHKTFRYFSSGMKQRLKLTLALLSDVDVILLDEPCSNLDQEAIRWYLELVDQFAKEKLIIVCSNSQPDEYAFCQRRLNVMDWK